MTSQEAKTLEKLESELERLKRLLGLGYEMEVRWVPDPDSKLSGEVKGKVIYVYDVNGVEAVKTLRHEYLDMAITHQIINPLVEMINLQKSLIVKLIIQRKEELIDRLSDLL